MRPPLRERVALYWRFARGIRAYLETPLDAVSAWRLTEQRLQRRGSHLLDLLRDAVYPHPHSPYRKLLDHAGCELGDVERLVREQGVEGALTELRDAGIYVSAEELKGQEIVRGSTRFTPRPDDFDGPCYAGHVVAHTGGSSGRGTRTVYDLEDLASRWAPHQILRLDAYGGLQDPLHLWMPVMPGAGPIALLAYAKGGLIPRRWFSPVAGHGFRASLRSRLGTWAIVLSGRWAGVPLPGPEFVPLSDAVVVARALSEALREHSSCWLATYVSAAARVSQAAQEAGIDLTGARFSVSSEPFTPAKRREIVACGARAYPMYAFMEAGIVSLPCGEVVTSAPGIPPDDGHLLDDCFAVIHRRRQVSGALVEADALLFTGLLRSSPKILLNTENGDVGVIVERDCSCRLGAAGLRRHLHGIHSFEKLTGEGMTFFGADLARIVEEVLPAAFGGTTLDYQLTEAERDDGRTILTLRVSPRIGDIDERQVVATVLDELARGPEHRRMMARIWRDAGILSIAREDPLPTVRNKVLPLRVEGRRDGRPR